ncbi:MAG: sensor histidine kinase [Anaerolineae bacterium]|nr:sensor histidine kinase [Anaerolineae bacterium]
MKTRSVLLNRPDRQGQIVIVILVVAAYAATFLSAQFDADTAFSTQRIALLLGLGIVYLAVALNEDRFFARFDSPTGTIAFFAIQSVLVLTISFVADVGAMWLLGLPLVGTAVQRLSPLWRWPIYAVAAGTIAVPVGLEFGWAQGLYQAIVLSPAIIFVVWLVKLLQRAQQQKLAAEALTLQLEDANRQLAAFAVQAKELAIVEERNRLAREIHDNLGHYLTVINVQIEAAKVIMPTDQARALDALEKAQRLTHEGLTAVRQSVSALRTDPVGDRPIPEAIAQLIEDVRRAGIVADYTVTAEPRPLDPKTTLTLYRIAQEGLTNVRRHAHASRVDVTLDYGDPDAIVLTMRDNGVGSDSAESGFGLLGMRERVQLLNGTLTIDTAPNAGFALTATLPG